MLDKRLQVLVDDERYNRLSQRAAERGTSVGALVREAIDSAFPATTPRRKAAIKRILDAPPMDLPTVADFTRELDEMRANRH